MMEKTPRWGFMEEPEPADEPSESCGASGRSSTGSTSEALVRGSDCSTDRSDTDKEDRSPSPAEPESDSGGTDASEKAPGETSFAAARAKFLGGGRSRSPAEAPAAAAQAAALLAGARRPAEGKPNRSTAPSVTPELEVKLRRQMLKCEGGDPPRSQQCATPPRSPHRCPTTATAALGAVRPGALREARPAAQPLAQAAPVQAAPAQALRPVRLSQLPERLPEAAKRWPRSRSRTNGEAEILVGNYEVQDDAGHLGGGRHVLSSTTLSKMVRPLCLEVVQEMRLCERVADFEEMRLCERLGTMEAVLRELQAASASSSSAEPPRARPSAEAKAVAELQASVARLEASIDLKCEKVALDEMGVSLQRQGAERQAAESKYLSYINRVSEGIQKVMPSISKHEKVVQDMGESVQRLKELCARTARATTACQEVLAGKAEQQRLQHVEEKLESLAETLQRDMEAGLGRAADAALQLALPAAFQSLQESIEANHLEIMAVEEKLRTRLEVELLTDLRQFQQSTHQTFQSLDKKVSEHDSQVIELAALQFQLQEALGRKAEISGLADAEGRLSGLEAALQEFGRELSGKATRQDLGEEVDRFARFMTQAKFRRSMA